MSPASWGDRSWQGAARGGGADERPGVGADDTGGVEALAVGSLAGVPARARCFAGAATQMLAVLPS